MKIGYSHFLNSLGNAKAYSQVAKIHSKSSIVYNSFHCVFPSYLFLPFLNILYHAFPNIFVEKANKFRCSVLTLHINLNPNPQISCLLIPNQNKTLGVIGGSNMQAKGMSEKSVL